MSYNKIRQEIEFLKDLNEGLYTEGDNSYYEGQDNAYNHILAFIDSLPEETSCIYDTNGFTPTPSVNIEDVARVQFASHAHVFDHKRKAVFDWEQFKEVAGIFYGFAKRDSLPEEKLSEDLKEAAEKYADEEMMSGLAERAFIAGAEWQANRLLKGSPLPEDTVLFQKGVEEGRRLEREDRNDDNLPRFYGD